MRVLSCPLLSSPLRQGLQYLLLFEALLLSAVVIYGALYWLLMPLRLHDKPIFFDYSGRATSVRFWVVRKSSAARVRSTFDPNLSRELLFFHTRARSVLLKFD